MPPTNRRLGRQLLTGLSVMHAPSQKQHLQIASSEKSVVFNSYPKQWYKLAWVQNRFFKYKRVQPSTFCDAKRITFFSFLNYITIFREKKVSLAKKNISKCAIGCKHACKRGWARNVLPHVGY